MMNEQEQNEATKRQMEKLGISSEIAHQIAHRPGCLTLEQCQQIAGRIWCDELMKNRDMHPGLAGEIANLLYEQYG